MDITLNVFCFLFDTAQGILPAFFVNRINAHRVARFQLSIFRASGNNSAVALILAARPILVGSCQLTKPAHELLHSLLDGI